MNSAMNLGGDFKNICVIGLGYVGLPTAAVFAGRGIAVLGVDVNAETVAGVNAGRAHFVEPDLEAAVTKAAAAGTLRAAETPEPADAFIIAVPTPFDAGRRPDLSFVKSAALSTAPVLKAGDLVVVESTCPVGTTQQVSAWLAEARADLSFPHTAGDAADVRVAHSPERVLPGQVLAELINNDRVIGGVSPACAMRAAALFKLVVKGECLLTNAKTAELVKLSENASRDVNIAFANELAGVAEALGVDPWEVTALANRHPRVNILRPGPGVGGHCIAVDPWFIVDGAPEITPLIRAARAVNDARPEIIAQRVREAVREAVKEGAPAAVACLGLAYKADIDDVRESPALAVCAALAEDASLRVLAVEPHLKALPAPLAGRANVTLMSLEAALAEAGTVAVLTGHTAFTALKPEAVADKRVIDARGIFSGF
ncbi:MAG: UDP-N-acetyl-D-mannosamine dehydrogenase [Rhodospirillales bacterium]